MTEAGVFRRAARVFRPWKNGGGETAEIVAAPHGAGIDDFAWRISTAIVAGSGPFSLFPGIDRVLAVLEGGAVTLTLGGSSHRLDSASAPFAFPGDLPVGARLEGAALLDFNVMVRRPLRATVRRGRFAPARRAADEAGHLLLLLAERAGLAQFDLVDLGQAAPGLIAALADAPVLEVRISG
ncbi:MAG TPA: HutD family protein [Acetobacteraceae bacterium]|nr:HutD family protein [Acetobacteraceae bacterium]